MAGEMFHDGRSRRNPQSTGAASMIVVHLERFLNVDRLGTK
jgi:hypothetical protein